MKISIRDKIILIMLVVIVISITSIGILAFNNAKAIVLNEAKQVSFKSLENANDYFLRKFMADMEHVVNFWADNEAIKGYESKPGQPKMVRSIPGHFQEVSDQWMGFVSSSPYIAWIYLAPEEDGSIFITPLDTTMPDDYDSRKRDWYREAVQNRGKAVWSDPYLDAGEVGGIVVTVARAVEKEGRLVGVVGMDIKLSRFSNIINDVKYGDEGYLMLINSKGEIFSHPDKQMLMTNISRDESLAAQLTSSEGIKIMDHEGKQRIVSYLTVPETGWKLVGVAPLDMGKLLAPIKDRAMQVAVASILVTFMIGLLLSRIITRPLDNIMNVIHNISQGKLSEHADIKSNDEFKVLGNQFNNMVDALRELIEERNLNVEELTKMNEEIRKNYLSTVQALANAIEASDKYTRGHCDRVSSISMTIARSMGVSSEDLSKLEFASILHDIGKIGISSDLLNKEGRLSQEEYEAVKQHPRIGHDILSDVAFLNESREILLQHHERVDGKGYPQGLKGDRIALLSKIISVADAYDAMTSSRPYRKIPLTKEQAIEEMLRAKGTQFDEKVIDCFVGLLAASDTMF
ncbi:HD domain-containing phosphohydrolase [Lutispora saccharofermentans]|uniref:HD domain-containing protein n=1 Tax=Lutispora saccharofermentans TaxID=3024236 RepID=A0ABT1NDX9_9FIRM|nr:HD domain-containing phosphohydrolase [Lutispora saccharofermentans]MCQ1529453.1 HD domain-containing protein [Lutispora saccharofermentans]